MLAGLLLAAPLVSATGAEGDWAAFQARWRAAMSSGEPAAIASLVRLPFLYEGRSLDRAGFERAAPTLFTPRLRRCLARAEALAEPGHPGERVMFCTPHGFHFDAQRGQWALREFSVDLP